jgi:hypothetical protein
VIVALIEAPGGSEAVMFGWWRRWRKTVARQQKSRKRDRRPQRFSDWDAISRYGDPSDGA